jgi:hypothetical protein
MPLDADPVPDGNVIVVMGVAYVVERPPGPGEVRYRSHFATCPNADHHRIERPSPKRTPRKDTAQLGLL